MGARLETVHSGKPACRLRRKTSRNVRRKPARPSMPSLSAPASPGCTCCTAFADSASPRGSMRPAGASAAPGTGTAIPARAATSKACNIPSHSPRSSTSNGTGRRNTRLSRRFSSYANHVADRFDLRRHILFDTRVTAATFDETGKCWRIETDRGDKVSAKFCIMAVGCLSAANHVPFRGREDFRGPIYHTGEWPHEGVDFTGLRVGVIGTGSSAIQSIPIIAQQASALTVFQRTATYSVPAWNTKLTPEYRNDDQGRLPGAARQSPRAADRLLFSVQHEARARSRAGGARAAI